MLRFEQVTKSYSGGFVALDRVSFHLEKGEMAFLTAIQVRVKVPY